jgi:UrcA family protein
MSHSTYARARLAMAILLASCAVGAPAYATGRDANALPTQNVRYGDLDLSSEHGQQVLQRRVRWAVKAVCESKSGNLTSKALDRQCQKTVSAAAQAQLSSILQGKAGGTLAAATLTISAAGR